MDHEGCVLGLVGSRDVPRYAAESTFTREILAHRPRTVVSGGAKGADTIAMEMARKLIPTVQRVIFRPTIFEWDAPRATPKEPTEEWIDGDFVITIDGGFRQRDEQIAEMSECLIRIASTTTKTYGSGWTADYAEKIGKRVIRYTVPGG